MAGTGVALDWRADGDLPDLPTHATHPTHSTHLTQPTYLTHPTYATYPAS